MIKKTTSDFLPKVMAERALWARMAFIDNPIESQYDDDCLVWCFCSEDNLWYSINGNYSGKSPNDKRKLEEEWHKSVEDGAEMYYQQVLYQSKIRKQVLERDKYTCQMCSKKGDSKLHVHHILKKKENGTDCLDNLITLCPVCHNGADSKKYYNPEWKI